MELLILLVVLPGIAFWIWMLIDCAMQEPDTGNTKIVWVIIIVLAGFIGAVIYFFARRPQRKAELGR
jgi:LPXTG-motif cell wall-anchored protein